MLMFSASPSRPLQLALVMGVLIGLHFTIGLLHEDYGRATSLRNWAPLSSPSPTTCEPRDETRPIVPPNYTDRRAKAAFVVLVRNSELWAIVESLKQMEDRFNKKFGYPYVFLNDEPFTEEFMKRTTNVVSSNTTYGLIPRDHWVQPDWIDEEKASSSRKEMSSKGIIYADSVSYRNMCRFNSGFFFHHELLKDYDYYWRIEPNVKYFCDLNYDPFLFMKDNGKVYGFTIALYEFRETIATLWETTMKFIKENPQYVSKNNAMKFMSEDDGVNYNLCHYWSNFEIADLNFWRGEAYTKYFKYLDAAGGFYYERWGDAPVHSIAASLFLRKDQIHFFNDIGYDHNPFNHCPTGQTHIDGKCWCDEGRSFDYQGYSCLKQFEAA